MLKDNRILRIIFKSVPYRIFKQYRRGVSSETLREIFPNYRQYLAEILQFFDTLKVDEEYNPLKGISKTEYKKFYLMLLWHGVSQNDMLSIMGKDLFYKASRETGIKPGRAYNWEKKIKSKLVRQAEKKKEIEKYLIEGYTYGKIGEKLKCSRERIRQLIDKLNIDVLEIKQFGKDTHGNPITLLRIRRGITSKELSEKTGLNYKTILDIENGYSKRLNTKTVQKLSKELWEPPEVLYELYLRWKQQHEKDS